MRTGARSFLLVSNHGMRIDNTKLRFGPYRAPPFKYGAKVDCLARGEVTIRGQSGGRIPWPIGKKGSALSLVLCGDLVKAVRREAAIAIQYWWGVSASVTWKWRSALGITLTEGDRLLRKDYMTPNHNRRMTAAATAGAGLSGGRGQNRAGKVKLRRANLGKKLSFAVRNKMSLAHKTRGTHPPAAGQVWSAEETALLKSLRPHEVARQTGRTLKAVYAARRKLRPEDRA